jgi:hypothetical protein
MAMSRSAGDEHGEAAMMAAEARLQLGDAAGAAAVLRAAQRRPDLPVARLEAIARLLERCGQR